MMPSSCRQTGLPADAGIMPQLLRTELGNMPILGVCLGLQAIGEAYGYKLKNLPQVYHGVQHSLLVTDRRDPLLGGLPDNFLAGRYHSWVVDGQYITKCCLRVSCIDAPRRNYGNVPTLCALYLGYSSTPNR